MTCVNCGKKGHTAANCTEDKKELKDRPCFKCGKPGHRSFECPEKKPVKKPVQVVESRQRVMVIESATTSSSSPISSSLPPPPPVTESGPALWVASAPRTLSLHRACSRATCTQRASRLASTLAACNGLELYRTLGAPKMPCLRRRLMWLMILGLMTGYWH